jgi:alpha-glucosidase
MGLGLGLSGVANTGHDVGGFAGLRPSPELFLRWVQNGIFHPRFTIHSWKVTGGANEPWMYPQILPYVREAIHFRYRLIPYLYNLMVESAATGHPIVRPMIYEFPQDPHYVQESFDFMLGSSLLVASVLAPFARKRKVYLPAGENWVDFYTHKRYTGGATYKVAAPLQQSPLFVREGSLIPMGAVVHPMFHATDDLRQILVFPHAGSGEASLLLNEDDGHSLAYQRGARTQLKFSLHSTSENLALTIEVLQSGYKLPYTELEFTLPAGEKRPLALSGLSRSWVDDESRCHYLWPVPEIKG